MGISDAPGVLWGAETAKAVENFRISGEPMPAPVIRWLGLIKAAAADVNASLGILEPTLAEAIAEAARDIAAGAHATQFPVDVFQTGSGTSSNMNVNEVISALTGGRAHPNDDVNAGQSSNDVVPSAVRLALLESVGRDLLPALETLEEAFRSKSEEFRDVVKAGRTHLMDAVPVTLGQELGGHGDQLRAARHGILRALPEVGRLPLGGTAVGNGLNTHPEFAGLVRSRLRSDLPASTADLVDAPLDHFAVQGAHDALAALSGSFKAAAVALTKISNDLRWMASGPRVGLAEITLPALQKGSSIMPGKVNPVIPEVVLQVAAQVIGNDTTITVAALQGNFELNVMVPVIARNALESSHLLATSTRALAACVDGMEALRGNCLRAAERTLASATSLAPAIGYVATERIVQRALDENRPLRDVALDEGVDVELVDAALDPRRLAAGNPAPKK
jgi:fumarate hydratase class II